MKKFILLFCLTAAFQVNTKAQNNLLADAGHKATLSNNINTYNKPDLINTHYFLSEDSTIVVKDHNYYMQKSRGERTAGIVLLGTGLLASGIGLLVATGNNASFDDTQTGVTIMGIGAVCGIVSIPLMIIAHANRNKAKLMLSNQQTGYGIPVEKHKNVTGLTLSIPIGK